MKDINFIITMISMSLKHNIIKNENLRDDIKEIFINDIYDDLERIAEKIKHYKDITNSNK